jgi:hypothetical protein
MAPPTRAEPGITLASRTAENPLPVSRDARSETQRERRRVVCYTPQNSRALDYSLDSKKKDPILVPMRR